MFEVYLGFAEPGDQYLGRLLAGLHPNKTSFAALPPHFICTMEDNVHVKEAMQLCFKGIIDQEDDQYGGDNVGNLLQSNTKAMLLRCLASMVHHSESLQAVINSDASHPFASIPIFSRPPSFLRELKKLISTTTSDRIRMPTGIPPHVEAMGRLDKLYKLILEEREERRNHYEDMKKIVADKIEEVAETNGQITRPAVERMFDEFGTRFGTHISKKIDDVLRSVVQISEPGAHGDNRDAINAEIGESTMVRDGFKLWSYDGKFWMVPQGFQLPAKTKRKRAWEFWIAGMTVNGDKIRPFRHLKPAMLPPEVKKKFKTEWQPIMRKMENTPDLVIPRDLTKIDSIVIETTFVSSTNYLKSNVCSFLWEKERSIIENWSVASWSTYTQRNYIIKNGNENDIGNLPISTRYNVPHCTKRTLKRKHNTDTSTEIESQSNL